MDMNLNTNAKLKNMQENVLLKNMENQGTGLIEYNEREIL